MCFLFSLWLSHLHFFFYSLLQSVIVSVPSLVLYTITSFHKTTVRHTKTMKFNFKKKNVRCRKKKKKHNIRIQHKYTQRVDVGLTHCDIIRIHTPQFYIFCGTIMFCVEKRLWIHFSAISIYIETETALHQLLNLFKIKKKNPLTSGKNMALHKTQESDEKKNWFYALETIRYGNMIWLCVWCLCVYGCIFVLYVYSQHTKL